MSENQDELRALIEGAVPSSVKSDTVVADELRPFILWRIKKHWFCIDAHSVERVLADSAQPTQAPGVEPFVIGLIINREQLIPIIDVSALLQAEPADVNVSDRTVLIIDGHGRRIAAAANETLGVVELHPAITSEGNATGRRRAAIGTLEWGERTITVLSADKLVAECLGGAR